MSKRDFSESPSFTAAFASLSAMLVAACQPQLPIPSQGAGAGGGASEAAVRLEPESSLDAAARVIRIVIEPAHGGDVDTSRLLFVKGHVGPRHVREAEDGELSQALMERAIPALVFARDGDAVIAPLAVLEPGATYGVLSGDPPLGVNLHVSEAEPPPILPRVWPPDGAAGAGPFAIFCGQTAPPLPPMSVDLEPLALPAALHPGAAARIGTGCLRIDVDIGSVPVSEPVATVLPPPSIVSASTEVLLEPAPIPLFADHDSAPPDSLACAGGQIVFGPGCARVEDDRVFLTTPDAPLFWAIRASDGRETVRAAAASEGIVLAGLAPSSALSFDVATVDLRGRVTAANVPVHTGAPRPHVVLSEVLANPLGDEPSQEWVEIVNDGLAPADLTGFTLADIGGVTPLPAVTLSPGQIALIVNETYIEDDGLDTPPAQETLLLRVPKLGKAGLKNDGEPLQLLDATGTLVSKTPAVPKPKPGQSLTRVTLSAPDGSPESFEIRDPTPGVAP